ncbi:hypothetical protein GCK72_014333 [Caenorhabditis remanei]|uniref:Uncharacterized protein n=1 Tax=Caenorhabditis remanei TaxID=31234 RepID=A0A6A5GTF5_CAERE|nr:hypothetical protein GCK72_014333 [Caenorhabditis remanei]KAF1757876.1 hypothetical protein GCK72_014333 [Caenorhabditis remanei]
MENDSVVFRKPYVIPHAGYLTRRRPAALPNPNSKPKIPKVSSLKPVELPIETVIPVKKTSDLVEVLKLKNLEESDYDRVRPTLVTLSAKQLKSFMDRNPGIEKIGDGLFRRHCQIDCPENIPKKLLTETWRTLHDVHINFRESESSNGLIILSVSGMSHNQAMRHLKQSLKFAAENDFISFSMFNQETNNNWGNLMKSFGNQEKIWESVRKINGSPTFLHTDSPKFSKMFGNQFDFHSNLYHNFNRQHFGHVNNCITDGSVTVEDAIDLWINSTRVFKHYSSYFSLLHLTEIAVPEDGKVVNLDEKLRISLEQLLKEGILDNTTVVVISDGGSGNSSVFEAESGKIEEKYGFFMIRLADSFRKKFPQNLEVLKNNVDREEILKELLNVVKKEVSMHKCLSKVKINDYGLDFRTFGSINFFKFDGFLVLEQVKISEEYGFSDPIQLNFHGKARFSISDEVHLELRSPLELEEINQTIIQNK